MSGYLTGSERGDLISSLNNAACSLRMLQVVCNGDAQLIEDLEASVQSLVQMAAGLQTKDNDVLAALEQRLDRALQVPPTQDADVVTDVQLLLSANPTWKLKVRFVGTLSQYQAKVVERRRVLTEEYSASMIDAVTQAMLEAVAGK